MKARDVSVPPAGSPGRSGAFSPAPSGPAGDTRPVPAAAARARDRADDAWQRAIELRDELIGLGSWTDQDRVFFAALEAWRAETLAARAAAGVQS